MSAYKLIDAEKANYPVSLLCRVLKVSTSGYYDWKDRSLSKRAKDNAALTEQIVEIHERSRRTYGYPRIHAELRALGVRCSRKRVARLMRKAGLRGCILEAVGNALLAEASTPVLLRISSVATSLPPHLIGSGRRTSPTSILGKDSCISPSS